MDMNEEMKSKKRSWEEMVIELKADAKQLYEYIDKVAEQCRQIEEEVKELKRRKVYSVQLYPHELFTTRDSAMTSILKNISARLNELIEIAHCENGRRWGKAYIEMMASIMNSTGNRNNRLKNLVNYYPFDAIEVEVQGEPVSCSEGSKQLLDSAARRYLHSQDENEEEQGGVYHLVRAMKIYSSMNLIAGDRGAQFFDPVVDPDDPRMSLQMEILTDIREALEDDQAVHEEFNEPSVKLVLGDFCRFGLDKLFVPGARGTSG